jgi:hypothetical protein
MSWLERFNSDSLSWLLEPDPANPSIRYFALRDLLERPEEDPEVRAARSALMTSGPVVGMGSSGEPSGRSCYLASWAPTPPTNAYAAAVTICWDTAWQVTAASPLAILLRLAESSTV